jgi:hypothetical protein
MIRTTLAIIIASIIFAADARADAFEEKYGKMITDEVARDGIALALSKIQSAKCDADKFCEPAGRQELAEPPLTIANARMAMVTAAKSALTQWCGLNASRSFLPMLAAQEAPQKMNQRQLQLIGLIHSDFMGRQLILYKNGGECPSGLRQQLDTQLPKM